MVSLDYYYLQYLMVTHSFIRILNAFCYEASTLYVQISVLRMQYCNEICTSDFRGKDAQLFVVILTYQ